MIKYYINLFSGAITSSDGFQDASAAELRVLLALIECGGAVSDEMALADLSGTTKARVASALALWEEAGVISAEEKVSAAVSDEFGVAGKTTRSLDVARSLRDPSLAAAVSECQVIFGAGPLGTEATKDIHHLYLELGLSSEYIVSLASYIFDKKKDTVKKHSNVMIYYTAEMKKEAVRLVGRGINTVEDLEIEFKRRSAHTGAIMEFRRATGYYGSLGPTMEKAINKWFYEYCYSPEMIARAYDIATQKSKDGQWYRLTAKIIDNWYTEGVKTVSDCEANDRLHTNSKKGGKACSQKSAETPKYGNFNSEDALMAALIRSYGEKGEK